MKGRHLTIFAVLCLSSAACAQGGPNVANTATRRWRRKRPLMSSETRTSAPATMRRRFGARATLLPVTPAPTKRMDSDERLARPGVNERLQEIARRICRDTPVS